MQAGWFRSDAGVLFGPVPRVLWERLVADEIDPQNRLNQALNCLVVETPAGRVLVETGIGERLSPKMVEMRGYTGDPIVPTLRKANVDPATIDVVAMSHLHFDHAGGLLLADGTRAFPRATIVAQRAEWEIAFSENGRGRRLLRPTGAASSSANGATSGAADGERELLPGRQRRSDGRPLLRPPGDRRAGRQSDARASSATCACGRGAPIRAGSPRSTTSRSTPSTIKGSLFARAADEHWLVALSHEPMQPVGPLRPDRDRFRYEPI